MLVQHIEVRGGNMKIIDTVETHDMVLEDKMSNGSDRSSIHSYTFFFEHAKNLHINILEEK